MDAFDVFSERLVRGENNPAILAAMARVAKATQRSMEDSKQQADQSKGEYEARKRLLGPKQELIIQKVDGICPTLQEKLEVIGQAVEDIPRASFMETLTQRATAGLGDKIDRSVNAMVAEVKVLLDSQTQAIPSLQQIDSSVGEMTTTSVDAIDEQLKILKVDLQAAICAALTDPVKGLSTVADGKQTATDTISEIKAASAHTTQEIGHLQNVVEGTNKEALTKIDSSTAKTHEEVNSVKTAMITANEEVLSKIGSSGADMQKGIEGIRSALDQATSVTADAIDSAREGTRLGLKDIEKTLEGQSSNLVSIQGRLEQVATCTQTLEDTFDKSKTESEGAWNRTIQMIAPLSTADSLLDAKQAILIKLDGVSQVSNAQLSGMEAAIESSFGKVQRRLGELDQVLTDRPTQGQYQSILATALEVDCDHITSRLDAKIAECKDMAITSIESSLRESDKTQQAQFKRDLESCQTAMCQAVQLAADRTEKLLSDKDQAIDQLRREYEAKLDAKDQEIKHLSDKVETLNGKCDDKEALNQLLKQQVLTREEQLKARDDLCKAREENVRQALSKEASSHQETLKNLNNREKQFKRDLEQATDNTESEKKKRSHLDRKYRLTLQAIIDLKEELKIQEEQATEEERVHMDEIIRLKKQLRAPFEANEITKILHDMALQVMELDIYPIEVLSGQEFVRELASQLLLTGSAGRFTSFVQEVNDEEWRCFIDVCRVNHVLPLPNNFCAQHEDNCPKVWVDLDLAPDKKVVYFEP